MRPSDHRPATLFRRSPIDDKRQASRGYWRPSGQHEQHVTAGATQPRWSPSTNLQRRWRNQLWRHRNLTWHECRFGRTVWRHELTRESYRISFWTTRLFIYKSPSLLTDHARFRGRPIQVSDIILNTHYQTPHLHYPNLLDISSLISIQFCSIDWTEFRSNSFILELLHFQVAYDTYLRRCNQSN